MPAPATGSTFIGWSGAGNRANNVLMSLSSDSLGTLAVRAVLSSGQVDLIVDVAGYFSRST
jgi:hypothetical protein